MEHIIKGIVKDSIDISFKGKEGNFVKMSDNLIHIDSLGVSLHIRGNEVLNDLDEVSLVAHTTKERNMIWFSIDNTNS